MTEVRARIGPEPQRPGGFARLALEGVSVPDEPTVVIRRPEDGLYLGPGGWQGPRTELGPLAVARLASGSVIGLGPEIVDRIETYTLLEIEVPSAGVFTEVEWPDTVSPSPVRSGGGAVARRIDDPEATVVLRRPAAVAQPEPEPAPPPPPEPEPEPEPIPVPEPEPETQQATVVVASQPEPEPEPEPEPQPEPKPRRRRSRFAGLIWLTTYLIAFGLGLALFLLLRDWTQAPRTQDVAVCDFNALDAARNADDPGPALMSLAALCQGTPGLQYEAFEAAMRVRHPEALMQFGLWYDPNPGPLPEDAPADPNFEPQLGISARYYREAMEAGAETAEGRLRRVCAALARETDDQSRAARITWCPSE